MVGVAALMLLIWVAFCWLLFELLVSPLLPAVGLR